LAPAKNPTFPRNSPSWAGSCAIRAAVRVQPWRFTIFVMLPLMTGSLIVADQDVTRAGNSGTFR
jgi:hypothetical protein